MKFTGNYHYFKAQELRSWLLFYSLPRLQRYLPSIYFQHLACLLEATHLLLGCNITKDDLIHAERLLSSFYDNFKDLYGEAVVGLNVHNLFHLQQCVRHWGPLWAGSCFGFESFNGEIMGLVHGTGNVAQQISWCIKAQKNLELKARNMPAGLSNLSLRRC